MAHFVPKFSEASSRWLSDEFEHKCAARKRYTHFELSCILYFANDKRIFLCHNKPDKMNKYTLEYKQAHANDHNDWLLIKI